MMCKMIGVESGSGSRRGRTLTVNPFNLEPLVRLRLSGRGFVRLRAARRVNEVTRRTRIVVKFGLEITGIFCRIVGVVKSRKPVKLVSKVSFVTLLNRLNWFMFLV